MCTDASTYIHTYTSKLELRLEKPLTFLTETTFLKERTQQVISLHFIHSSQHPGEVWICHLSFSSEVKLRLRSITLFFFFSNMPRVLYFILFFLICSEFCHTLKWNVLEFTCLPHPDPPSHLPLHLLPPGPPRAPGPSACLFLMFHLFTS